jgi:hypothetical protein
MSLKWVAIDTMIRSGSWMDVYGESWQWIEGDN